MKKQVNPWVVALVFVVAAAAAIVYIFFCLNVNGNSEKVGANTGSEVYLTAGDYGSASRLGGKTAIVVIFADDMKCKWDKQSEFFKNNRRKMFEYLPVAADWLTEQGAAYGKTLEFVYPKDENDPLLYYEGSIEVEDLADLSMPYNVHNDGMEVWDYIGANVKSEEIKAEYGCDNIAYILFLEVPGSSARPYAFSFYDTPLKKPYEFAVCCINEKDEGRMMPSTIAHEMLHLFGAPDLYTEDILGRLYNVNTEFVVYISENYPGDIMYATTENGSGDRRYDGIAQKITPITAYYLGWIESPTFDINRFGVSHSQFDMGN